MEKYERNGLTVSIEYDTGPESPREWDNLGVMVCSHKRYNLGDEQVDPDDYDNNWEDLEKYLRDERNAVVVLPLGLYDHSGITMYVGDSHDRFDGGQVGFIYCDQKAVDQYGGTPEENLENTEKALRGEVKDYDQFLRGDVYGYIVTNPRTGEEVDSLWGIYGIEYAKDEANSAADAYKHPVYVTEPLRYDTFKELFKLFSINPYEFQQLSGEKVMGYFPNLKYREPSINLEKFAEVLWGKL